MTNIYKTKYTHRFLARFILESKTPLAVGSGEKDITTDALVATDVNGLPYIPGTAIAGIVRSMIDKEDAKTLFGFQEKKNGEGSKIIFTEAKIVNSKREVIDGMNLDAFSDDLLKEYKELPIRQHVSINEKGVAKKAGKFDEQVVFAGTRFCFELEMYAKKEDEDNFDHVLKRLQSKTLRIGSGTRCGFGEFDVIELKKKSLDLTKQADRDLYLEKSSNLSKIWSGWNDQLVVSEELDEERWYKQEIKIQPEDFFLFGSGFGDEEADMTPVKAKQVTWDSGIGKLVDNLILIPATSVKGALAHRVAFYWNKLNEFYAGDSKASVGTKNPAVQVLFGYEDQKEKIQTRGNVIISDILRNSKADGVKIVENQNTKVMNHVSIDRFTGGAKVNTGALFQEKSVYGKGDDSMIFIVQIIVDKQGLEKSSKIIWEKLPEEVKETIIDDIQLKDKTIASLKAALEDLKKGLLPLGGCINRGYGIFKEVK